MHTVDPTPHQKKNQTCSQLHYLLCFCTMCVHDHLYVFSERGIISIQRGKEKGGEWPTLMSIVRWILMVYLRYNRPYHLARHRHKLYMHSIDDVVVWRWAGEGRQQWAYARNVGRVLCQHGLLGREWRTAFYCFRSQMNRGYTIFPALMLTVAHNPRILITIVTYTQDLRPTYPSFLISVPRPSIIIIHCFEVLLWICILYRSYDVPVLKTKALLTDEHKTSGVIRKEASDPKGAVYQRGYHSSLIIAYQKPDPSEMVGMHLSVGGPSGCARCTLLSVQLD